jgi:hypothetical protein
MTNFDITDLGLTAEPETIAPEEYVAPWEDTQLPIDKAIYEAKLVDGKFKVNGSADQRTSVRFGKATSKKNGQGYLMAEFAVEVQGFVNKHSVGSRFIYGRVDCIPEKLKFEKTKAGRENANAFMDLLVAFGYTGRLASNDDYANALLGLVESGAIGRASIDKEIYSNPKSNEYVGTGDTIRGEENIPGVPDGQGGFTDVGIRMLGPGHYADETKRPILLAKNVIKRVYPIKK